MLILIPAGFGRRGAASLTLSIGRPAPNFVGACHSSFPWPAAGKTEIGTVTHVRERAIGAVALVSFVAVMYCGRMLPFLGNSF